MFKQLNGKYQMVEANEFNKIHFFGFKSQSNNQFDIKELYECISQVKKHQQKNPITDHKTLL